MSKSRDRRTGKPDKNENTIEKTTQGRRKYRPFRQYMKRKLALTFAIVVLALFALAIVLLTISRDKNEEYQRFAEEYDIHFIFEDHVPGIDFYTIPMVEIFALDNAGGYIGSVGQSVDLEQDIPICYIDKEKKCYLIATSGKEFLENVCQWKKNLVPYSEIEFLKSLEEAKEKFEFVGSL